jgi:hypothetical protein
MQTARTFIIKPKRCANPSCAKEFKPFNGLQVACSLACAIEIGKIKAAEKESRAIRKVNKGKLDEAKTKPQLLGELQTIFNVFIRTRDADQPCISCGTTKPVQYHAGHFFTVGSYPGLRYHEDNVHKQCGKNCNKEKHGNIHEYRKGLLERIGPERMEALETNPNRQLHLSIPEIKDMIVLYRSKIKNLTNEAKQKDQNREATN